MSPPAGARIAVLGAHLELHGPPVWLKWIQTTLVCITSAGRDPGTKELRGIRRKHS